MSATSTQEVTPYGDGFKVRESCNDCIYTTETYFPWEPTGTIIAGHLAQHDPGRALDIEVDWQPVADCTVCEDGGDINATGDGLECDTCGTTWTFEGTNGEITE